MNLTSKILMIMLLAACTNAPENAAPTPGKDNAKRRLHNTVNSMSLTGSEQTSSPSSEPSPPSSGEPTGEDPNETADEPTVSPSVKTNYGTLPPPQCPEDYDECWQNNCGEELIAWCGNEQCWTQVYEPNTSAICRTVIDMFTNCISAHCQ